MKTLLTTIFFVLIVSYAANSQTKYYYTTVSSPDKTTDYLFGFYPSTLTYTESASVKPYTSIKAVLLNQKGANPFKSNNDKIMILLKSGKMIRNYTTQAKEGDYAVEYTTQPGENHTQYYCFNGKVEANDIDRVWYILSDTQIFELLTAETKSKE
ncbi:hypothetical protein [Pedobacter alpinus]|uniref:DUF4488 domain-containing protein n=1 Tax=Pedobacter alpinus TaxID=1590643 RepID=A0ABW5TT81_9SPHI